jgi:hypothetical protein
MANAQKFRRTRLSAAVAAAAVNVAVMAPAHGEYQSGDFHNHTTCSDGATSIRKLSDKSLEYLDWFIQTGHSGTSSVDCRTDDFAYNGGEGGAGYVTIGEDNTLVPNPSNVRPEGYFPFTGDPLESGEIDPAQEINGVGLVWKDTIGEENVKGDEVRTTYRSGSLPNVRAMWRWQSLQEFSMESVRDSEDATGKPSFLAEEWVVPGHEHADATVIRDQYDAVANKDLRATALGQFEYCFARNSNDTSQGGGQGWTCEISDEGNQALIDRYQNDPSKWGDLPSADYNAAVAASPTGVVIADGGSQLKSTAAVVWLQENFPSESFAVPAHVARQGAFIPDDDEGFNVEDMRDWHTFGPDVAFGMEGEPGHQAQASRGSYNAGRPTSGLFTWGGGDCYANAEATRPGLNFDGEPVSDEEILAAGGTLSFSTGDRNKVVLCRPGVRTMWDAMLSEGRRYWYFGSSDWHNRGSFAPFDYPSTNDFWPGEYQKNYAFVEANNPGNPAQDIVDGLRSGDGFVVMGDLITDIEFKACVGRTCAGMGETLTIESGDDVRVFMAFKDPRGTNESPYAFDNPSLLQIGRNVPVNEPELVHVDLIKGEVTGPVPFNLADGTPNPEYRNPLAPPTTVIEASWEDGELRGRGEWKRVRYTLEDVTADSYLRLRGSNMPAGTPNETDEDGNPLSDHLTDNIACSDPACPPHVDGIVNFDLEAWVDLWFHSNPIFIEVADPEMVAGAE